MIKRKILISFVFCMIFIQNFVNAKYVFEYTIEAINLDIDRTKPIIEIVNIENTNLNYEKYANKTHNIIVKIKIIEKNIINDVLENDEINVLVGNEIAKDYKLEIITKEKVEDYIIYDLKFSNLLGNGNLNINIIEGAIIDTSGLKNEQKLVDTNIQIDNISPKGSFIQEKIEEGRVKGTIKVDEKIRKVDGWNISDDSKSLNSEFLSNVYYELQITDYAQNSSTIKVHVSEATNIILTYGSHNSEYGWSYGYSNYDIAGKEAVKVSKKHKTEALAFLIKGNVEKDFLKVRAYDYTHWGEGTSGICKLTKNAYKFGYNPGENSWYTMYSLNKIKLNNEEYFELGGGGVNLTGNTDSQGRNPIPYSEEGQYNYGISGINMELKDDTYYSIIYQILVDEVGWIEPKSDGVECVYKHDKPFSAMRIALIPKNQKEHIYNMWKKDIGTFNGIY